jgi:predicted MFS family arabinose efflux permease
MKFIVPAMILDGFLLGFTTTNFSNLLNKDQETSFNVGLLHISNGVGAILGGYLSGILSSKMSVLREGVILFGCAILTLLLTFFIQLVEFDTIAFPLFITFLWGITLFFLEGWLFVCCVRLFNGAIESFAVVKQMHTLSFIIFQVYSLLSGQ